MDVYFQQISSMATSCIIGVEYQNQEMDMGTVHNFTYTNGICICTCVFSSVQLLSCVWLFENPYTGARQTSLSITNSRSLLKLMFVTSVISSNHFILCHPLFLLPSIFPSIRSFLMSQFFVSGGQSIGISTSTSVLPMNIQNWFPLGLIGWISFQSNVLSKVFLNTTGQKYQFFCAQLSL